MAYHRRSIMVDLFWWYLEQKAAISVLACLLLPSNGQHVYTHRVKKLALLSSRNVPRQPRPSTSLMSSPCPHPYVPSSMAGRGSGGHRVEEGVKEEPQNDPDGEAHQHPSERQPPVGQGYRGEDHGDHHKTQMENQPFFVQTMRTTEVTSSSSICRLATSPSRAPSRPTSPQVPTNANPAATQGGSARESVLSPSHLRRSDSGQVRSPMPTRTVTRYTANCGRGTSPHVSPSSRIWLARPACGVYGARDLACGTTAHAPGRTWARLDSVLAAPPGLGGCLTLPWQPAQPLRACGPSPPGRRRQRLHDGSHRGGSRQHWGGLRLPPCGHAVQDRIATGIEGLHHAG